MDFETYRPLALSTAKMFPTARENLRHAALGFVTEIGEYAKEIKRAYVYGLTPTEKMINHMIEEIGDAQWYVPLALEALGFSGPLPAVEGPEDLADMTAADITLGLHAVCVVVAVEVVLSKGDNFNVDDCVKGLAQFQYLLDHRIAADLGTTGDAIRAANIAKLQLRYPEGYSDAAAEARADKGGLSAQES